MAAAICAALHARGEAVAAFKPALTGLGDEPDEVFGRDHELLAWAAGGGQALADVAPYRFGPPVSPHYAAELAGERIEPAELVAAAQRAGKDRTLVCEGVGGLLVPLTSGYLVRDLAVDLGLPVVVAARAGLGTINHSLLTVEAARAAGLEVAGMVMTPWPDAPEPIERSNRETVARLAGLTVGGLPPTTPAGLADAGRALPLDAWV